MIGTLLLNRYEVLEKIGEGGMGIVYKAKCTLLNRFVAIKILKAELSDDEDFIDRFKREANSIASLSYSNIVSIYDVGSENNINFIVMEYIDGKTLKQIIKDNVRLTPLHSLDIAFQIAKALEFAHKNNIIHRDIKPDNILVTEDNIVKLTDFGIAKVANSLTITNSNKIIGSVHYFSPEQAKGKHVDCTTDIYALGIVMYEMITGKVPFNRDSSIAVALMHIQDPVIPPKELIEDIPENINSVILKALEKDPINRFQTAKELANILNAIKENINLKINFDNKQSDATTVIMLESDTLLSNEDYYKTVVMEQEKINETVLIKKDKTNVSPNNKTSKNKKILLIIGVIILVIIVGLIVKYLSKESNADIKNESITTEKNSTPEESEKVPPEVEKTQVPSLIGKSQDAAKDIIVNNGFLIGNVVAEYSDTVPKGFIISQSPTVNTYYEKNGKIDLVISQGKKITQTEPQSKNNGNGRDKEEKSKKNKNNK